MPDFDWRRQTQTRSLANRFADSAIGWRAWEAFARGLATLGPGTPPDRYFALFDTFRDAATRARVAPGSRECRVFVSHRGTPGDTRYAERIAWLAVRSRYGYWLDVHDPQLAQIPAVPAASPGREILIAAIIEMALLNSTHVIAVMTPDSQGSKWIPYEFGRAKEQLLYSRCSATWMHNVLPANCGEYVHLGVITYTEDAITGWLANARTGCGGTPTNLQWPGAEPAKLP